MGLSRRGAGVAFQGRCVIAPHRVMIVGDDRGYSFAGAAVGDPGRLPRSRVTQAPDVSSVELGLAPQRWTLARRSASLNASDD